MNKKLANELSENVLIQNDCGSNKTSHSCAGQSKMDLDPNDFKAVKTGTCEKMGGSLVQGKAGKMAMEKKG